MASKWSENRRVALWRVLDAVRGDAGASLVDAVQSEDQRVVFDRITALMSLLEGHADHVMDAVGPTVVPTVATIRARFTARRRGGGLLCGDVHAPGPHRGVLHRLGLWRCTRR